MFEKGMVPAFPGDFQADVAAGTLPQVSWLVPSSPLDEHPPAPPSLGQLAATRQALDTLMSNPAIWEKTVLFVTWDENGGFFDHVPPPVPPRGTAGEWLMTKPVIGNDIAPDGSTIAGPIGLGFRVPMLVLSPFAVGGLVCSDTFDHTSTLRFIETRFGVPVPNLAPWRRASTGDLTSAINFVAGARPTRTTLGAAMARGFGPASDGARVATQCTEAEAQSAQPKPYPVPTPQSLPSQEPGRARRPSGPVC
jgi:phospholipase C